MDRLPEQFTNKELRRIEKNLNEEGDFITETLTGLLDFPKETPLKTIEQQLDEQKTKIEKFIKFAHEDAQRNVELFISNCLPEEVDRMGEIFQKITSKFSELAGRSDSEPITIDDCQFLEEIAKRKMISHEYVIGSQMYRFIVQINGFFSEAWVGWALCEQDLSHVEVVDYIYQMALELMPQDYYIILFAADFYVSSKQKEKAISILEKAKQHLVEDHLEGSHSFKAVQEALKNLK